VTAVIRETGRNEEDYSAALVSGHVLDEPRVAHLQLYAVGWQKSGSSIMTMALSKGMETSAELEAVQQCCCNGVKCAEVGHPGQMSYLPRATCVNDTNLSAPLFGDDMSHYARTCARQLRAGVVKSDDMIWQIDSLMHHVRSLPAHASGAGIQFIYYVRHPLFNIRSLLAWCAETGEQCETRMRDQVSRSNNTLFLRIYTNRQGDALAATPVKLASTWRDAARVYLRDPSRFAAVLRYEDFMRDPVQQASRVLGAARDAFVANMAEALSREDTTNDARVRGMVTEAAQRRVDPLHINKDALQQAIRTEHPATEQRTYDHDAATLFDDDTTKKILAKCADEMHRLGYTSTGVDDNWVEPLPSLVSKSAEPSSEDASTPGGILSWYNFDGMPRAVPTDRGGTSNTNVSADKVCRPLLVTPWGKKPGYTLDSTESSVGKWPTHYAHVMRNWLPRLLECTAESPPCALHVPSATQSLYGGMIDFFLPGTKMVDDPTNAVSCPTSNLKADEMCSFARANRTGTPLHISSAFSNWCNESMPDVVFVDRGKGSGESDDKHFGTGVSRRSTVNADAAFDAIAELARGRGLRAERVMFESMPFREQMRKVCRARMIVLQHGAAMMNFFATHGAGTRVMVQWPPWDGFPGSPTSLWTKEECDLFGANAVHDVWSTQGHVVRNTCPSCKGSNLHMHAETVLDVNSLVEDATRALNWLDK
jgi:hypothetical protein